MNQRIALGLAMLAGAAFGATAVNGLKAQTKPPTYVVIDIGEMTDPEGFKAVPASPAASPAATAALGPLRRANRNGDRARGNPTEAFRASGLRQQG